MRSVLFAILAVTLAAAPTPAADDLHPIVVSVKEQLKNPDKPFTMLVTFKVKPGMHEKFEAAFADCSKRTRQEKGNLVYQLNRDVQDTSKYVAYEQWKNITALAAHLDSEHTKKLLDTIPDLTAGQTEIRVAVPVGE